MILKRDKSLVIKDDEIGKFQMENDNLKLCLQWLE